MRESNSQAWVYESHTDTKHSEPSLSTLDLPALLVVSITTKYRHVIVQRRYTPMMNTYQYPRLGIEPKIKLPSLGLLTPDQ